MTSALSNCLTYHKNNKPIKQKAVDTIELVLTITGPKHIELLGPIIKDLAINDTSPSIRKTATSLLDLLGDDGLPYVCAALDDKNSDVVLTALLTIDNLFRSQIYNLEKFQTTHIRSILNSINDILLADVLDGRVIREAAMLRQMLDCDPYAYDDLD
jgi:hypothetical protein